MEMVWKDLRFALRMLRRTPGVAAAAVIALALGIGANTAIFSVVDGVLLRPLPYQDSRALVVLHGNYMTTGFHDGPLSYPEYQDFSTQSRSLSSVSVYAQGDGNLSGGSGPADRVLIGIASATLLPTLGVTPLLGRNFTSDEERKGNDQVALLDYDLWQRRYAGDRDIVGKSLVLDGVTLHVVGVLPRGFRIGDRVDMWLPLSTGMEFSSVRGAHFLTAIGRRAAGSTPAQLTADLAAITQRQVETYPNNYRPGAGWQLSARPLLDEVVGNVRVALFVLLGAVGFVLLIACANVANLMLARAATRQREMAIRTALGAGRARLVRQLLTESVLLALLGGGLGLLLAVWGIDGLVAMSPDSLPRVAEIALDQRVLAFTVGVSLLTGIVFGLIPALSASRPDLHDALKDGTRGTSTGRGRLRKALVVAEVALSLVLLVGTGLMVRSFLRLRAVDPGFRSDHALTLRVSLPGPTGPASDADKARYVSYFQRANARLQQLPGVTHVGATNILPLDGNSADLAFEIQGWVPRVLGANPDSEMREVTPGYFEALGIPLKRGRLLAAADDDKSTGAVVVNETFVRHYWPDGDEAIGKQVRLRSSRTPNLPWSIIVGVVGDVHDFGLDAPVRPEFYVAHAQMRRSAGMAIVVRTSGDPSALAASARAALAEIDPLQPVFDVKPMNEVLSSSLAQRRFTLSLMLLFAVVALALAAVGIYGVMAYTVAQRTQELGIRMALGARAGDVLAMVVREGMVLVAIGLGSGLVAALALTRLVSSLLFGVSSTDLVTYGAIALVLAAVALLATIIPARRATRVDPMLALRAD